MSVIVCTRNRPADFARLLWSLREQTLLPIELIVVDASDSCATCDFIDAEKKNISFSIKYIQSAPCLTQQRNAGARQATGDYICFLDDDVVLDKEYLSKASEAFRIQGPVEVGGITGKITNAHSHRKWPDRLFSRIFFLTESGSGRMKPSGFPTYRNGDAQAEVEVLSGCNMMYSREVLYRFSFDEKLHGYCYMEDVDFSYRVGRYYRLIYQPKARLEHFPSTYRTADSRLLKRMLVRNQLYLARKNLPRGVRHRYALAMSIAGQMVYNLIVSKNIAACRGIAEGILGIGAV